MNKIELPEFKRYEEEADFWDNLDTADFMLEDDEWFHFDTGKRSPLRAALLSPEVQYPMPARDLAHQAVKHALEKDGWTITHDPLFLSFAQVEMYVDLGAEQLIVADRNGRKIAVEIKGFLGSSTISEFYTAPGQFLSYRLALEIQHPGRDLYLAVPFVVYDQFFRLEFGQLAINRYQLRLIVYDEESEGILEWIE